MRRDAVLPYTGPAPSLMCVLAFAWQAHPRWRLVLAGNRDEFHARPAQPLGRWTRANHVLAGIDLQSGGTWLGVSERGRLAVVTNLRGFGVPQPDAPSRGALLADFLTGEGAYAAPALPALGAFNPFNLITAEGNEAVFRTNRPQPVRHASPPGIHGISNGPLDAPWFKTERLRAHVGAWLAAGTGNAATLLDALRDDHAPAPDSPPVAPSDIAREPPISPIFIRDPVYGTRCGTVVTIDADGRGTIVERRYDPDGEPTGESAFTFRWPG